MERHKDEDWMREKYVDEGLSYREIADILGTSKQVPEYWIEKHGISARKSRKDRQLNIHHIDGYEYARTYNSEKEKAERVPIHRLAATLKVDDITELRGKDVHHKDECVWNNSIENLEVLSRSEHRLAHTRKK